MLAFGPVDAVNLLVHLVAGLLVHLYGPWLLMGVHASLSCGFVCALKAFPSIRMTCPSSLHTLAPCGCARATLRAQSIARSVVAYAP